MKRKIDIEEAKVEEKITKKENNNYDKLFIGILLGTFVIICILLIIVLCADKLELGNKDNKD